MPKSHPRPWHAGSTFSEGPRHPLDRERRAVWKERVQIHRRAGRITDGESYVGEALIRRLGIDGRLDPSHQTLADDSGESVSTVKRALKALHGLGMLSWARRLARIGQRVVQTSNSYLLTLGNPPQIPAVRCEVQRGPETRKQSFISAHRPNLDIPDADRQAAEAALARRRAAVEARLLTRGAAAAA